MNRDEINKVQRDPVACRDLEDALKQVLTAPRGEVRSENREPTREELKQRRKLRRR